MKDEVVTKLLYAVRRRHALEWYNSFVFRVCNSVVSQSYLLSTFVHGIWLRE